MQSISGACRKALPARDEGNGKQSKKLIHKVVKSNKKDMGVSKTKKRKSHGFSDTPKTETDKSKHQNRSHSVIADLIRNDATKGCEL